MKYELFQIQDVENCSYVFSAFLIADYHHSAHKKVETNQAKEVFI